VVKWYCPFADQRTFPSGHRYCINIYTGCTHGCVYCYAAGYWPEKSGPKQRFARQLAMDLEDLEKFDVPPAPVHVSNSTDPFQPLEVEHRDTLRTLKGLLEKRHRFTTVTVLTRNPLLAARPEYARLLADLARPASDHPGWDFWQASGCPPAVVEVSLPFWREEAAGFWDPKAPGVRARVEGVKRLAAAGVPLVLRIDPLFPRNPVDGSGVRLGGFGLEEPQSLEDLRRLVAFAKEVEAHHVVYSAAKVVKPRFGVLPPAMVALKEVYARMAGTKRLEWGGGSWRLPRETIEREITGPFKALCAEAGVRAMFCMESLLAAR
jgi:DNA repair photolyase